MALLTDLKIRKIVKETNKVYRKRGLEEKAIKELQKVYDRFYSDIYFFIDGLSKNYNIVNYASLKGKLGKSDLMKMEGWLDGLNLTVARVDIESFINTFISHRTNTLLNELNKNNTSYLLKALGRINKNLEIGLDDSRLLEIINKSWSYGVGETDVGNIKVDTKLNTTRLSNRLSNTIITNAKQGGGLNEGLEKPINKSLNTEATIIRTATPQKINEVLETIEYTTPEDLPSGEYYLVISRRDSKVCSECDESDGRYIPIKKAKVGINTPLFHAGCRCRKIKCVRP